MARGEPHGDALNDFNGLLSIAVERMRVAPSKERRGRGLKLGWPDLGWPDTEQRPDSVIWPVIWSAASLLVSEEAPQLRICGGEDCGWMYVDRSRNGLRRWCQMETCGTRAKSPRRYRRMRRSGGSKLS